MAASAVGPSSQGTENTMWSLTDRALNPSCAAVSVYVDQMIERVRVPAEVHQRQMRAEVHRPPSHQRPAVLRLT